MRPIFLLFAVLLPFAGGAAMLTLRTKNGSLGEARDDVPHGADLTADVGACDRAAEGALTLWRFTIDPDL